LTNKDLQADPGAENPPVASSTPVAWADWHAFMPFGMFGAILWLGALSLMQYGIAKAAERDLLLPPAGWPDFTWHAALMVVFTAALLGYWAFRRKPLWALGLSLKRLPGDLWFTLVAMLAVGALYALGGLGYYGYLAATHDEPLEAFRLFLRASAFNEPPWMYIFGVVILYPVLEEVWFRGVLYAPMRRELGRPVAVILTALIFAFAHGNLLPINQFIGGIVFVLAYEYRRTLVAPILLHIAGNGALVAIGWIPWIAAA